MTAMAVSSDTKQRSESNFLLIWMNTNIEQSDPDYQNKLAQLQSTANDVNVFTHRDECIDFLTDNENSKATMIIDGVLCQDILPLIHDIPQLDNVYILCYNKVKYEEWTKAWIKVNSAHTTMPTICESLQQIMRKYKQNSIAMSFVPVDEVVSSPNLNQLDPTFMYTQLFKEILLDMDHNQQSIDTFVAYCKKGNLMSSVNIIRFANDYNAQRAIFWYTSGTTIYSLLNTALRMLQADTIITMGFFIYDLNRQLTDLHQQQQNDSYRRKSFIRYRGQGLSKTDFDRLRETNGGLISFNNFLSTSADQEISLDYAIIASQIPDMIGVLFHIFVDPAISSVPYATIREVSALKEEEETLFSMHTVFRIGQICKIGDNASLYQVNLELTAADDQQLRTLTHRIREEVRSGTSLDKLCMLLVKIGQLDSAEEICYALLQRASDQTDKVTGYNRLGYVKERQGDYEKAIWYYKKGLQIDQKTLPRNYRSLAIAYDNIATVYSSMGKYSQALVFFEKVLLIRQKTLPPNHPDFSNSYNNIAALYDNLGEPFKALSSLEKALENQQKNLPPNHPDLTICYNNIASLFDSIGEYSKALSFHKKSLDIRQRTLPRNHPSLAVSYSNIGMVYRNTKQFSKALSFFEIALEIQQKTLSAYHADLATSYNNIASVYSKIGENSKAISLHQKALEIQHKALPSKHPYLAGSYINIGLAFCNAEEYFKALSSFEKALEIQQAILPPTHPTLATSYNNIASIHYRMRQFSKALPFFEKVLQIRQNTLHPNHLDCATVYNNIALVYDKMGDNYKALSFYQKALEIRQKALPPNHRDLAESYDNIASVFCNLGEPSKAISFFERALTILKSSLPLDHPHLS